jgi:4-hydroxymandelate oxidase
MKTTRREALTGLALGAGAFVASAALSSEAAEAATPAKAAAPATKVPPNLVALSDFEQLASKRIPHPAWEYIQSGAADEITLRRNREAFEHIMLDARVLRDTGKLDTSLELLGHKLAYPVMLAPSALHTLAHPEGEVATATGAGKADAAMVLSTMSSRSVEDVNKAASQPVWFQLYVQADRGFTKHLVQRAEDAGCKALCVTVDTPTTGPRNRSQRSGFDFPPNPKMANLADMPRAKDDDTHVHIHREKDLFQSILPESLTWKDIEWIQSFARVPVVLKGVLHPDDAEIAVKQGIAGVIVSNHGARNLDTAPATIEALPRVADKAAGRMLVLMDGGVRRGTDVLKALALGANAVLIGRPVFYGLAVAGAAGVTRTLNILRSELEMAMALVGVAKLNQIDGSVLWKS